MIDTSTVSYIIKGRSPSARDKLASLQQGEIACISAITEGELHFGLAKLAHAAFLRPAIEGFLSRIQVLSWGKQEAYVYGSLRANQERAGKPVGNLDLLIAAHAIAVRAVLVTADKTFSLFPELSATVNWANEI